MLIVLAVPRVVNHGVAFLRVAWIKENAVIQQRQLTLHFTSNPQLHSSSLSAGPECAAVQRRRLNASVVMAKITPFAGRESSMFSA